MALIPRPFAEARPHGEISEVLPGFFFVTGTVGLPGPLPVRFSRNMTIVREGDRLVLVNSVRLDARGLAALDKLGKVTDVIRLAANHGLDDPFYADRYGARVWVVKGQRYTAGFDTESPNVYFEPGAEVDGSTALPIEGAKLVVIDSRPPEGMLLLPHHGGTVISGDCLQNFEGTDAYFNLVGKVMLTAMGFAKPCNIGPGWLRQGNPPKAQLRAIGDLSFANVFPAHGKPVLGDAVARYRPAIARVAAP